MGTEQASDRWAPARLIPTAGIKGIDEQERRATSALLAVMKAVPEFGHALLKPLGAPKGRISTFTEVPFKHADGKECRPDGAIVIERGKTRWVCLVEVKTSDGELGSEQVSRYIDVARAEGFDAVLTISNAITSTSEHLPFAIDGRKLRTMTVRHLSWWRVITEAVVQRRYRRIDDPDQDWILGELIAYMDHDASGANGFTDMGPHWVKVREAAHAGTLRASDPEPRDVCERFEQLTEYLALGLAQDLGADVRVVRGRGRTPEQRVAEAVARLAADGQLCTTLKVPDAVGPLELCADLRTRRVCARTSLRAPEEGRPQTNVTWLTRQLADAPADLRIEVTFNGSRETTSELLSTVHEDPASLLSPSDPKRSPKAFTIELARPLGTKRGTGQGSFVGDTQKQISAFYGDILQVLTEWQPRAPRLHAPATDPDDAYASEDPPSALTGSRPVGRAVEPA